MIKKKVQMISRNKKNLRIKFQFVPQIEQKLQ